MRHDFDDQIQVRYRHHDGEFYDTWVSGEEVLGRMRTKAQEDRLKGIKNLSWHQIGKAGERLPDEVKERVEDWLLNNLADGLDENLGGNLLGDALAGAIRGEDRAGSSVEIAKERWSALLYDKKFRAGVLELAWIQLEGSFPEDSPVEEPDDWI